LERAIELKDVDRLLSERRGFCSFVYSNACARERIDFFRLLSPTRQVASGGAVLTTVGGRVEDKIAFARGYKFAIAFENASHPGYTTEKLLHAFISGAVPIYWGNPLVARDFNPRAFINCHDFADFQSVVDHVRRVDADDALYRQYLAEPCFEGNTLNPFVDRDRILDRFGRIFMAPQIPPVARSWRGRSRRLAHDLRSTARRMRDRWRGGVPH
jgi:hypothetical protein